MAKMHVETTINGDPVEFLCSPEQTLLDVLRDELQLTGSKEGCSSGDCGACSASPWTGGSCARVSCSRVGRPACHSVETIEGMAERRRAASVAATSFSSTPRCSAASARRVSWSRRRRSSTWSADPTETQVRYWLAGNLCRCTGYDKIVRAVLDAAADMRNQPGRAAAK